jgi:transcriptional regulator GlxA family with amidase domain
MDQIGIELSLSPRQLQRLFRKHLGCSPSAFIKFVRLKHGRKLLATTDYTVTQIAQSCGFTSVAYFCREFRRLYNVSALEARAADRLEAELLSEQGYCQSKCTIR